MRRIEPVARQRGAAPLVVAAMLGWQSIGGADTLTMATQVAAQFNEGKLNALAVEVPNDAGRFVAAIIVGRHILAISAVHPEPARVRQAIAAANHWSAYSILSTSGNEGGRLFIEDFGEPGLTVSRDPSGACDVTWRDSAHEVTFDGDWLGQELSEAEYHRRFASDEAEYAEMLRLLHATLSSSISEHSRNASDAPASSSA